MWDQGLAEDRLASQEGLCSIQEVSKYCLPTATMVTGTRLILTLLSFSCHFCCVKTVTPLSDEDIRKKDSSRQSQEFFICFKVLLQHVSAHV